jgi:hypothetical protein
VGKTIATISGVALAPGVSRNGRLYTRDAISRAVTRAQERIAAGKRPIAMYTHHDTRNTADIAGGVTKMWQDESGAARYEAKITDTKAGRDIATLADPGPDGDQAVLRGLSIRGDWLGPVQHVRVGGQLADTAADLEISRLDWTSEPGVDDAGVDTFALAGAGQGEDATQYGISESAPDALLTITEEAQEARVTAITEDTASPAADAGPPVPDGVREALREAVAPESVHTLVNGECRTCSALGESATPPMSKRGSGLSGDGGPFADPGYQNDKKQRYQLDTKAHAKAAWAFINKPDNAKLYSGPQLRNVKARILKALKSFGVSVAAESGWTTGEPYQVNEAVREWLGDAVAGSADRSGSWCITAANGPVSLTMSSYCMDPADIGVILRAAADAACKALHALDPDMDGDVDVPGVGPNSDPDGDAPAETAPAEPVTETSPTDPAPEPVAEPQVDKEVPAMADTASAVEASPAAPSITLTDAQFAALMARSASQPAPAAAEAAPAAAATAVAESDDDRIARLVEERAAERLAAEAIAETEEQRIERLVEARVTARKQELVASGQGPARKGLTASGAVDEHTARAGGDAPPAPPGKSWDEMHLWSTEELNQYATPQIANYIFKR